MLKNFLRSKEHCKYWLANVTLESFENWILCLARSRFHLSFVGLLKKITANGKEACQDDQVQVCLLSYLSKESLVFLGQNVSNLCQSIFVVLTVYCDKIFKLFTGILFFDKTTIQFQYPVLKIDRRLITSLNPFFSGIKEI